jgi:hypothetical protein
MCKPNDNNDNGNWLEAKQSLNCANKTDISELHTNLDIFLSMCMKNKTNDHVEKLALTNDHLDIIYLPSSIKSI